MRTARVGAVCVLLTSAVLCSDAKAGLFSSIANCRLFRRFATVDKKTFDYTRYDESRWDVVLGQMNLREANNALRKLFTARGGKLKPSELSSLAYLVIDHLSDLQKSEPTAAWELFETLRQASLQVDLSRRDIRLLKEDFKQAAGRAGLNERAARKIRNLVDFQPFGKTVPENEARLSGEISPTLDANYLSIKPAPEGRLVVRGTLEGREIYPIDVTRQSEQKIRVADRAPFLIKSILDVTRTGPAAATITSPSHEGVSLTIAQRNPKEAEITGTFGGDSGTNLHAVFDGKTLVVTGKLGRHPAIRVAIEYGAEQARQLSEDPLRLWAQIALVPMAKLATADVRFF